MRLDYLWIDRTYPYGVMLFWPAVQGYFSASLDFLPGISRTSYSTMGFVLSLFSLHNLWTVFMECLMVLPVMLILLVNPHGQSQPDAAIKQYSTNQN